MGTCNKCLLWKVSVTVVTWAPVSIKHKHLTSFKKTYPSGLSPIKPGGTDLCRSSELVDDVVMGHRKQQFMKQKTRTNSFLFPSLLISVQPIIISPTGISPSLERQW